jgi:hypothetical protein
MSSARYNVLPPGRRSGKTELAKRKIVKKAMRFNEFPDGTFIAAAPTHQQAKRIWWADLCRLVPKWFIRGRILSGELTIPLLNGARIMVMGMDKPERAEGFPIDYICLDEYGNMKASVWTQHLRPGLSTVGRPGAADFIGVPEGRNHYYGRWKWALRSDTPQWAGFHWKSSDILDPDEIAEAAAELDELTFQQEYEGSFINFQGRIYYAFDAEVHAAYPLRHLYDPHAPLVFQFDFNVSPGVAAIAQEVTWRTCPNPNVAQPFTAQIGEVWIPRHSNTVRVCRKLVEDWGDHKGDILCYGDATGGAKGTAKVEGSDWDLIKRELKRHYGSLRVKFRVPKGNPRERVRVNATNSRLRTADGTIRMLIDPDHCPHLIEDFEGVIAIEGGAGEIDKDYDDNLTHISDGVGYYIHRKFPMSGGHQLHEQRL